MPNSTQPGSEAVWIFCEVIVYRVNHRRNRCFGASIGAKLMGVVYANSQQIIAALG